jgi:hypothetical protein
MPFFDENNVRARTVELVERPFSRSEIRKGDILPARDELDACALLERELQILQKSRKLILVRYDLHTEFKWVSERCPSFASYFSCWIDVQELVAQRCDGKVLGLTNALLAFNIIDNRRGKHHHSAANDAVRFLAILAALLASREPIIEKTPPMVKRFPKLRRTSAQEFPFTVYMKTEDGSTLPDCTWAEMCNVFAQFDLKAVGRNTKRGRPVYTWWLAFNTVKGLQGCMGWIERETIHGKNLRVVSATGLEKRA